MPRIVHLERKAITFAHLSFGILHSMNNIFKEICVYIWQIQSLFKCAEHACLAPVPGVYSFTHCRPVRVCVDVHMYAGNTLACTPGNGAGG